MTSIPQLPQTPSIPFLVPGSNLPISGDIGGQDNDEGIQIAEVLQQPTQEDEDTKSEVTETTTDVKFKEIEQENQQFPQGGFVLYGKGTIPLNSELEARGGKLLRAKIIGKDYKTGKPRFSGYTGMFYPKEKYDEIKSFILSVYPDAKTGMIPSRGSLIKTGFKPQEHHGKYVPRQQQQSQEHRGEYIQYRPRADKQVQKQTITYTIELPEQGMRFDVFSGDKKFTNVIERVASHNGIVDEAYFKSGGAYKRLVIINGVWQIHGDSSVHSIVFNA